MKSSCLCSVVYFLRHLVIRMIVSISKQTVTCTFDYFSLFASVRISNNFNLSYDELHHYAQKNQTSNFRLI